MPMDEWMNILVLFLADTTLTPYTIYGYSGSGSGSGSGSRGRAGRGSVEAKSVLLRHHNM